jgi:hypothetical protein
MPFALIFVGVLFLVVGYRGTERDLITLLKGDFTGPGNFIWWIVSIMVIGALGYVPKLKSLSDGFLVLVLLVLFISNPGFFSQFTRQVTNRAPSLTPISSPDFGNIFGNYQGSASGLDNYDNQVRFT